MNVKELIEELSKIENKERKICLSQTYNDLELLRVVIVPEDNKDDIELSS